MVKDEGCGIRREELPRIFDKFYRAGGSEKVKGAGLGLFIVKVLVEAMGGNIMVVSDPGEGAQFTVSLLRENGERSVPEDSVTAEVEAEERLWAQ